MNYGEIPYIRKQIQQLKKIEEKQILSKINNQHQKEKKLLDSKYSSLYSSFHSKKQNEQNKFQQKLNTLTNNFKLKQQIETNNFSDNFNRNYPKEENLTKYIIQTKERINYFLKIGDYNSAEKLKNELNKFIENKHKEYEIQKQKEYEHALSRLRYFQNKERGEHQLKIENLIWEYNNKNNKEYVHFNTLKNNKMKSLDNIHNDEMNEFKNYIYGNNCKEGYKISKAVSYINA